MILPQAVVSTLAPSVNALGSGSASLDKTASGSLGKTGSGSLGKKGTTGENPFGSLLAAISSDLSDSAGVGLTTGSGSKTTKSSSKSGSGTDDQNQQNAAAAVTVVPGAAVSDPLLLGLFSLMPAQSTTTDPTSTDVSTQDQSSGTTAGATPIAVPQVSSGINVLTMSPEILGSPVETNPPAIPGQTKTDQQGSDEKTVQDVLAPLLNAATAGNEGGTRSDSGLQVTASSNAPANGTAALQPVFTLNVRPQAGAQSGSAQQPGISVSQTAMQNSVGQSSLIQNSSTQTSASQNSPAQDQTAVPQTSADVQNAVNIRAANTTVPYQTSPATAVSNASPVVAGSSPNIAPSNAADTSAAITSAAPTTKGDTSGSGSDGKPSDGQAGDRQAMAAIVESAVPAGPSGGTETQFNAPHTQPATEYVNTQTTPAAHANGTVTDLRLQVDGAANQHVDVRVVQQADGLRLSVRSSDPMLAQSLRDHAPELTSKLEQHHYATEMLLQKGNDSQPLNLTNTRANLQQDFSGRQQGSGGQPNQQNKQNEQQRQQPKDDDDQFSAFLGLRS